MRRPQQGALACLAWRGPWCRSYGGRKGWRRVGIGRPTCPHGRRVSTRGNAGGGQDVHLRGLWIWSAGAPGRLWTSDPQRLRCRTDHNGAAPCREPWPDDMRPSARCRSSAARAERTESPSYARPSEALTPCSASRRSSVWRGRAGPKIGPTIRIFKLVAGTMGTEKLHPRRGGTVWPSTWAAVRMSRSPTP